MKHQIKHIVKQDIYKEKLLITCFALLCYFPWILPKFYIFTVKLCFSFTNDDSKKYCEALSIVSLHLLRRHTIFDFMIFYHWCFFPSFLQTFITVKGKTTWNNSSLLLSQGKTKMLLIYASGFIQNKHYIVNLCV